MPTSVWARARAGVHGLAWAHMGMLGRVSHSLACAGVHGHARMCAAFAALRQCTELFDMFGLLVSGYI